MSSRNALPRKPALAEKLFNVCVKCRDYAFNRLFFLPCGGEASFRRRCVEFASLTAGNRVLDVCCGTGELTAVIAEQGCTVPVVGIDISESSLEIARIETQRIPVTFLRASADDLPFDSSQFDRCFISFGLHHMPERERKRTLAEIHRVLAPEGILYVIDYNLPERGLGRPAAIAFAKHDRSEEAYEMLKNGSLIREVKQAGFEIARRGLTCRGIIQILEVVKK
jgi:demethylmenaquinone methyltransferase/2-methoxy-6-polyprenyl-1,4-benzoquinol methylase